MVPFEAFWMSSPQSSMAFCNGCDGGTQCDSFSSKVLSCADAVPRPSARPSAASPQSFKWRVPSIGVSPWDLVANRTFPFNRRKKRLYMFVTLPCRGRVGREAAGVGSAITLPHPPRKCAATSPLAGGGGVSIPRIVLGEIGLKFLQDRVGIVAGLLHRVGPRLHRGHGCRFPQIELRVRDRIDLLARLGLELGDAVMLEIGPRRS